LAWFKEDAVEGGYQRESVLRRHAAEAEKRRG
jgi:hypothetical protein